MVASLGRSVLRRCVSSAQHRPWLVTVLFVFSALAGVAGASRLTISADTEGMIDPEADFRQNLRAYERVFPQDRDQIIAVIDADEPWRARFAVNALAMRLKQPSNAIRSISQPSVDPYLERMAMLQLGTEALRSLQTRLERSAPVLDTLAARPDFRGLAEFLNLAAKGAEFGRDLPAAMTDLVRSMADTVQAAANRQRPLPPAAWQHLLGLGDLGPDQRRQLLIIDPVLQANTLEWAAPALATIRSAWSEVATPQFRENVKLRLTGQPALRQQELDAAFSGALYATILSFLLVGGILFAGIRSWRLIAALMSALLIGVACTAGLAALAVGELNLISLAFAVLFVGLGIDFGAHLVLRYREGVAGGDESDTALARATVGEGPAIVLGTICAAVAFLSFWPTAYKGLAELGIISALGMGVALLVTLILLPALITLLPVHTAGAAAGSRRFKHFIERWATFIVGAGVVLTVTALALGTQARIDVNPLNLQNPDAEAVKAYRDLASDPRTSPYAMNVVATGVDEARALASRLRRVGGVAQVTTPDQLVPDDQEAKAAVLRDLQKSLPSGEVAAEPLRGPEAWREAFQATTGAASELAKAAAGDAALQGAAQRLAAELNRFARQRGTELEALGELNDALMGGLRQLLRRLGNLASADFPMTMKDVPEDLRSQWIGPDGQARVRILPAGDVTDSRSLETLASRVQAVAPEAVGLPISVTEAAAVVRRSFLEAIVITAIAIAILVALLRRNALDVVLILMPVAVATIWTVGAAAVLDVAFNFANVIAIPLLLGVGIASSIHMVSRARERQASGAAIGVLDTSTPRAVLLTDANTVAAFSTLAISAHWGLASMGILLGLAIALSLVASVVLLPAVLALWRS